MGRSHPPPTTLDWNCQSSAAKTSRLRKQYEEGQSYFLLFTNVMFRRKEQHVANQVRVTKGCRV